jgi:hypothetical protein
MKDTDQTRKAFSAIYAKLDATADNSLISNRGAANQNMNQLMTVYNKDKSPFCIGRVTFSYPLDYRYTVSLGAPKNKIIECIDLQSGGAPFAVKTARIYAPQTTVFVYWDNDVLSPGIILGAIADAGDRFIPARVSDSISNLGVTSPFKDDVQRLIFDTLTGLHYGDLRAIDSTIIGELSYQTILGSMFHIDPFQIFMRMGTGCGIWMNEIDHLLRIVSKVYKQWTPASTTEIYCDNDSTALYTGISPNSWEALGILQQPSKLDDWSRNTDSEEQRVSEFTKEPIEEELTPFYRVEHYDGWMGQGGLRQIKSLPESEAKFNKASVALPATTVFRESVSLDGCYNIKAINGVFIERQSFMPMFDRVKEPNHPDGDHVRFNFEFLGNSEDRPTKLKHKPGTEPKSVVGMLEHADGSAREEYKALYPFIKHEKDFKENNNSQGRDGSQVDSALLKTRQFQNDLELFDLNIGSPQTAVTYATRKQGIYLLPDGGILIKDAFGNEIRTGAGGIEFLSSADINIRPDRRAVIMSGDDTVITANKSIDITSAQNDIRMASYQNMEFVSGIGKAGRMLLENRGTGSKVYTEDTGEDITTSGIQFVAKTSDVCTYCNNIYTHSKYNLQNSTTTIIKNDVTFVSSSRAVQFFTGQFVTVVDLFVTTVLPGLIERPGANPADDFFNSNLLGEQQNGNETTVDTLSFSFRNVEQYGTSDYVFVAPAWQQTDVKAETDEVKPRITDKFDLDRIFNTLDDDTSGPFPGKERWTDEKAYWTANLQLYDQIEEKSKSAIADHKEVETYAEPYKSAPTNSYSATIITRQKEGN